MTDAPAQLPPADELADVRLKLRWLQEREEVLRQLMIADPSARTGNHHAAQIREVTTTRTDIVEMRKMYPDLVAEYTFPAKTTQVVLVGISEDGELIPTRRATKGVMA
jgi:hypothetical protein